jgi:hypothetical protein
MGVPTSEVGYTSATAGRGDHVVHKGHVVAMEEKKSSDSQRLFDHPVYYDANTAKAIPVQTYYSP